MPAADALGASLHETLPALQGPGEVRELQQVAGQLGQQRLHLSGRGVEERAPGIDPVDPLVGQTLVQGGRDAGGVLGEEERVDVEAEG